MLLNRHWLRGTWATKKPGRRWGPSWRRSERPSWTRRTPRRTRLLRQHYLVQRPQGDTVDRSSKAKRGGSDQYELFLPAQSRQIFRIPKFERKHPTTEPKLLQKEFYRHDRGEFKEQFGQNSNQQKSDLFLPMRNENRIGRPKKSAKPLKARIIRVRRKKAVETLIPTMERDRKISSFFPQSFFSKNQQNRKTSGQDRRLLDVIFPRSLFSGNQYAKTKWNDQPE